MSVRRILVGVDDSEGSRRALDWAAELAADLSAEAVAVHVYEPLAHLEAIGPGTALADVREEVIRELDEVWCEPLERRGVETDRRVVEGTPHEAILAVADETGADLIVLGARRIGVVKAATLGSTSHRVVQDADIPVAIVHSDVS